LSEQSWLEPVGLNTATDIISLRNTY